jgi:hypothetical protein
MTPSQIIEIRQAQPAVHALVMRAAQVMAATLNIAAAAALGAAVVMASERIPVWAAMPSGETFPIVPLAPSVLPKGLDLATLDGAAPYQATKPPGGVR